MTTAPRSRKDWFGAVGDGANAADGLGSRVRGSGLVKPLIVQSAEVFTKRRPDAFRYATLTVLPIDLDRLVGLHVACRAIPRVVCIAPAEPNSIISVAAGDLADRPWRNSVDTQRWDIERDSLALATAVQVAHATAVQRLIASLNSACSLGHVVRSAFPDRRQPRRASSALAGALLIQIHLFYPPLATFPLVSSHLNGYFPAFFGLLVGLTACGGSWFSLSLRSAAVPLDGFPTTSP